MVPQRLRPIDLKEDQRFTRGSWRFERAGWIAIGALVIAAVLGLTGPGLLSDVSRRDEAVPFEVRYTRFPHFQTGHALRVRLLPASGSSTFEIWIDEEYRRTIDIDQVEPEPARITLDHGRSVYAFNTTPGPGPREVVFRVVPRTIGRVKGRLGIRRDDGVALSQFVFP